QTGVDQDPGQDGAGVHRAARAGEVRRSPHGVPGGRLPQHLRVLGRPRGDVPHRRRPVHPALRLLPDRHRQAAAARPRRAAQPIDRDEPRRVAESVRKMGLAYATIPGVARDDLPDGGAWLYAETVREIHRQNPDTGVENLIPDFNGKPDLLAEVFDSRPEVLAHNVETVPRIFKRIRPAFRYDRSLGVLTAPREFGLVTKSNLILGMGETP